MKMKSGEVLNNPGFWFNSGTERKLKKLNHSFGVVTIVFNYRMFLQYAKVISPDYLYGGVK